MRRRIHLAARGTAAAAALGLIVAIAALALPPPPAQAQERELQYEDASLLIFGESSRHLLGPSAVGDVNGDGVPDLVIGARGIRWVGSSDMGGVSVVRGPIQAGRFEEPELDRFRYQRPGTVGFGGFVTTADIDGDGFDDVITTAALPNNIYVRFGAEGLFEGEGRTGTIEALPRTLVRHLAVGDLNGDGAVDIAAGSPIISDEVIIYFGPFAAGDDETLRPAKVARIREPTDAQFFGWTIAVGDVTEDGQADLAINYVDDAGFDSVAIVEGPFAARTATFGDGSLEPIVIFRGTRFVDVESLAIGDVDLDSRNDLVIGLGTSQRVAVVPGGVIGPARFPLLFLYTNETITGFRSFLAPVLVSVGDYDGDQLADLLVGSPGDSDELRQDAFRAGSLLGFAGVDRQAVIHGVRPTQAAAGSEVEIRGQGLVNATILFRGQNGMELEAEPSGDAAEAGAPSALNSIGAVRVVVPESLPLGMVDVVVRTDLGEATLEDALTVRPSTNTLTIAAGWNLVGWTDTSSVEEATASLSGSFTQLYKWDAGRQTFIRYRPESPAFLSTVAGLAAGDGIWLHTPDSGTWKQPALVAERSVELLPGFNLVMWTGPDGTSVAEAIDGLGDNLVALFTWDGARQEFLRFAPGGPPSLNTATTLNFGDGVWIRTKRSTVWEQPANLPPGPPAATNVQEAQAAVVVIDEVGSGFIVNRSQVITAGHVVGGRSSVTVRFIDGEERQGFVSAVEGELDIAVIELASLPDGVRRLKLLSEESPAPATAVWAWAWRTAETSASVTVGIVSAIQTDQNGLSLIETDAALNPGHSGGPLILEDGRVAGINDFIDVSFGEDLEGQNFAIDVAANGDRIRELLAQ